MFWMYCAAFTSPFIALFIRFTAIASCLVITWPSCPFSVEPSLAFAHFRRDSAKLKRGLALLSLLRQFSTTCSSNWLSK